MRARGVRGEARYGSLRHSPRASPSCAQSAAPGTATATWASAPPSARAVDVPHRFGMRAARAATGQPWHACAAATLCPPAWTGPPMQQPRPQHQSGASPRSPAEALLASRHAPWPRAAPPLA
eukprot:3341415-Alexandrium_andersonii.AAC.1